MVEFIRRNITLNVPASLSIRLSSSGDFIDLNLLGVKLNTLICESENPEASKLESSDMSTEVTLQINIVF